MKLNFTISEFLKSDTATRFGIDNKPHNNEVLDNILLLIVNVMQPLRDYVGKPIIITSGYRSIGLNAKVGGIANSQHLKGQACDFVIQGMTINEAIKAVKNSGVIFDQCINEGTWVHISFNKNGNRKQFI